MANGRGGGGRIDYSREAIIEGRLLFKKIRYGEVTEQAYQEKKNNNNEKILLTTMLTIKILFTINSLEKKNYSFKTLFTIPVDLKST